MTPGTPFPPLNLNLNTSSRSGDIGAPNTVNFGGFGLMSGGGGLGGWLPLAVVGVAAVFLLRR